MRRSLCAAFVAAMCAVAATVNAQYVNDNVQRTVEFQGPVVREQRAMAVVLDEAAGKEHVPPPYIVAVEVFHPNTTISHVAVKDKKSGRALVVTPTPVVGQAASVVANGAPSSRRVQLYAVRLPDNAKERTSIVVDIVYNHGLVPYPRAIAQRDRQLVEYRANVYVPSPYVTRKQRLKVTYVRGCGCVCGCVCMFISFATHALRLHSTQTSSVESYTKSTDVNPVAKSGRTLTYGPYERDTPAYSYAELYVHSENNEPFLTVTTLTRELWVSHWAAQLAVEERYQVRHDGAR